MARTSAISNRIRRRPVSSFSGGAQVGGDAFVPLAYLDTDGTLTANSDAKVATQKAVKTYADSLVAVADAMIFKGVIDCSANPNYPAADRGHTYRVSVAGKIGGASGTDVLDRDMLVCMTDGTVSGTQAAVGAQWFIVQGKITGTVLVSGGPLGTPSSGVGTNLTGTASGLTAGNVTTNANLTGDVTSVGNATTLTNAPVIAKVLTGYASGAGTVAATDSILQAIQKLNGNDATNANLTGPITSVGNATSIASQTGTGTTFAMSVSPTFTGNPAAPTQTPGDNSTKLATTSYVDAAVLGQNFKEASKYATTAALPTVVYSNGSSGVGATLTGAAFGALSLDSNTPSVGDRVLVKNQVSTFQNGIYTVTTVGAVAAVFVMTRATDADQSFKWKTGDSLFVTGGTLLGATTWAYNGIDSPTMGTDAITFAQTAGPGTITSGNGITITGLSVAIDTSVTVDKTTAQVLTNKTINGANNTLTVRLANDITGFGTGVATALAVNVGSAGAFVAFNGAGGTPSSITLTNATGTAASLTAGNASAVALGGVTGLGTGVATALAINVGSAGAFVVLGGALGTPSSATLTSATGLPIGGGTTGTLGADRGGTGVANNVASKITISGSFGTTITVSATTAITLPTSGLVSTFGENRKLTFLGL